MSDRVVSIEKGIDDIRKGKMIILVDNEERENEGDLCCAAELVTPEVINFMATHGRGLICLPLTNEKADSLDLKPMVYDNKTPFNTAFTVSIDAAQGVTTGISAYDRATTVLTAVREDAQPTDFFSPGHIFPLRAREGGVLVRSGQTEGSVDLARIAGLHPAGVICEIMKDDGSMARMPDLQSFAMDHDIDIVTISDLITYRIKHEKVLKSVGDTKLLPWLDGQCDVVIYQTFLTPDIRYLCLVKGDIRPDDEVFVGVYKKGTLYDLLCWPSGEVPAEVQRAMKMITAEQSGVLVYMLGSWDVSDTGPRAFGDCLDDEALECEGIAKGENFNTEIIRNSVVEKILSELGVHNALKIRIDSQN